MSIAHGIKLWTTNIGWFAEARRLHQQGLIDFVELYVAPGSVDLAAVDLLRPVPITIHAPHENHAFNTSALTDQQVAQFRTTIVPLADIADSRVIIVHAGVGPDITGLTDGLRRLAERRIVVENMPKEGINGEHCFGYSLEQIAVIHEQLGYPICVDFGHAIKTAAALNQPYREFLDSMISSVQPSYFHLSDGDAATAIDDHLDLGRGNFDLAWIKRRLEQEAGRRQISVVFEVPKNGHDLANDRANIERFNQL